MVKYSYSRYQDDKTAIQFVRECEKNFDDQVDAEIVRILEEHESCDHKPFITLCGPTCSGKTTAAKKIVSVLGDHLVKVNVISIDDFYYNTDKLKRMSKEKGMAEIDYESIDTIDVNSFESFVNGILDPMLNRVECPVFNFNTGRRVGYRSISKNMEDIFLFEGIQAFYPEIQNILGNNILKNMFISTQSCIEINGNKFEPNEIRLFRRLVRDNNFRSTSAEFTFDIWGNVRKNEDERIFPYSYLCENTIDSVFACEISLLKPYLVNILSKIDQDSGYRQYSEEIIKKINDIQEIPKKYLSENSLYKEFI